MFARRIGGRIGARYMGRNGTVVYDTPAGWVLLFHNVECLLAHKKAPHERVCVIILQKGFALENLKADSCPLFLLIVITGMLLL